MFKSSVSGDTYVHVWELKLNHNKQSNGCCRRQSDASLWGLSDPTQARVGEFNKSKERKANTLADLYGFVHISSTQGLQGDSKGSPGGIQVVLHHLITKSKQIRIRESANPDVKVIKNIRKHTRTFLLKVIFGRKTFDFWLDGIQLSGLWGKLPKLEFTSVLWASCHPVAVCLKNSRYGSDFPKKSCKQNTRQRMLWRSQAAQPDIPAIPCYLISLLQPQNWPPCYLLFPLHRSKAEKRNDNLNLKHPRSTSPFLSVTHSDGSFSCGWFVLQH